MLLMLLGLLMLSLVSRSRVIVVRVLVDGRSLRIPLRVLLLRTSGLVHGSLRVRGDRVLPPRGLPDVHLFRRLLRVLLWVRWGGNCSGLLLVRLLRVLTRLTDSTSVVLRRVFRLCGGGLVDRREDENFKRNLKRCKIIKEGDGHTKY